MRAQELLEKLTKSYLTKNFKLSVFSPELIEMKYNPLSKLPTLISRSSSLSIILELTILPFKSKILYESGKIF